MSRRLLRLFLDSNVLVHACVSPWSLDKAVLALCAAQVSRLVSAEPVRDEVEEAVTMLTGGLAEADAEGTIENYRRLIELTKPEIVPYPEGERVRRNRHLLRHQADVPVLLAAMDAKPDWLLTHNTRHFTSAVARRTGVRIATPAEFFRTLSSLFV